MDQKYNLQGFRDRCDTQICRTFHRSAEDVFKSIVPLKKEALLDPALESSFRRLRNDLSFRNRKECMSRLRAFPSTFGAPGEETLRQRLQNNEEAIRLLEQLKREKTGWVGYDYRNYYQDADNYLSEKMCNNLLTKQRQDAIDKAIRDDMAALRVKLAQML